MKDEQTHEAIDTKDSKTIESNDESSNNESITNESNDESNNEIKDQQEERQQVIDMKEQVRALELSYYLDEALEKSKLEGDIKQFDDFIDKTSESTIDESINDLETINSIFIGMTIGDPSAGFGGVPAKPRAMNDVQYGRYLYRNLRRN